MLLWPVVFHRVGLRAEVAQARCEFASRMSPPLPPAFTRGEIRGKTATMSAIAEKDQSAVGIELTVHGISNIDQVAGTFCVDEEGTRASNKVVDLPPSEVGIVARQVASLKSQKYRGERPDSLGTLSPRLARAKFCQLGASRVSQRSRKCGRPATTRCSRTDALA